MRTLRQKMAANEHLFLHRMNDHKVGADGAVQVDGELVGASGRIGSALMRFSGLAQVLPRPAVCDLCMPVVIGRVRAHGLCDEPLRQGAQSLHAPPSSTRCTASRPAEPASASAVRPARRSMCAQVSAFH